jgi:hypothetical protein
MYRSAKTLLADHLALLVIAAAGFAVLWNVVLASRPVEILSSGVATWWVSLCAVSIFNICGWRVSAAALTRRKLSLDPAVYVFQRRQLLLSAVYVLGCGFRSILPRADVQRIGLYDSWMSSVLVGRSVATVAELCFVAQWALLLHAVSKSGGVRSGVLISWILVPLILVAELCSWYSVLTTSYIGNALEETLWAVTASLLVIGCVTLYRWRPACRPFLAAAIALGVAYVAFMLTVDIPMYVSRWQADEANGRKYLSLAQGLSDVWCRWHVTFDWDQWRTEIPWMSLYFTVAVWCSIALAHIPWLERSRGLHSSAGTPA